MCAVNRTKRNANPLGRAAGPRRSTYRAGDRLNESSRPVVNIDVVNTDTG
jgi:hypothetical protein